MGKQRGWENSGHCSKRGYSRAMHGSVSSTDAEMNKNVCPFIRVQHSDPFAFDWARSFHGSPRFTRFFAEWFRDDWNQPLHRAICLPSLVVERKSSSNSRGSFSWRFGSPGILFLCISTTRENMDAPKYGNISYLELWNISPLYTGGGTRKSELCDWFVIVKNTCL